MVVRAWQTQPIVMYVCVHWGRRETGARTVSTANITWILVYLYITASVIDRPVIDNSAVLPCVAITSIWPRS